VYCILPLRPKGRASDPLLSAKKKGRVRHRGKRKNRFRLLVSTSGGGKKREDDGRSSKCRPSRGRGKSVRRLHSEIAGNRVIIFADGRRRSRTLFRGKKGRQCTLSALRGREGKRRCLFLLRETFYIFHRKKGKGGDLRSTKERRIRPTAALPKILPLAGKEGEKKSKLPDKSSELKGKIGSHPPSRIR